MRQGAPVGASSIGATNHRPVVHNPSARAPLQHIPVVALHSCAFAATAGRQASTAGVTSPALTPTYHSHAAHSATPSASRKRTRALAAAVETVAKPAIETEYMGVIDGMLTVRGALELDAHPTVAYEALKDYEATPRVFHNIVDTVVQPTSDGPRLMQVRLLGGGAPDRLRPLLLVVSAHCGTLARHPRAPMLSSAV